MSEHDDERLRLMTPEEIAAMDADDYDADEDNAAALAEIGRGAIEEDDGDEEDDAPAAKDEPEDDGAEDAGEEEPEAASADDAGEGDATGDDAPEEEPEEEPEATPERQPGYRADLPVDMDVQVSQNKQAMAALRRRLHEGDIDYDAYEAQLQQLEDQREQLQEARTRSRIAAEMAEQARNTEWVNTINLFVKDAATDPALGQIDYRKDAAKQQELDTYVRALGANAAHNDKPMRWFLETAHRMVMAAGGIAPKTAPAAAPAKPAARRADASKVVTSLADVAGSAGDASPSGDEFADLDKLTGLEYERALSRLSAEKRAQYLMAS